MKDDICQCAGSLQVCAGQEGGSEAAIHAMRSIFHADESDCVLLVDAKNTFNTLNRNATLHNSRIICPALSTILINTYRVAIPMYVIGGETIQSVEGTTQGDPLAMAMYAIGTVPLISSLAGICKQVWFADDATGAGTINEVWKWWDKLTEVGGDFGYQTNATKSWLIVKPEAKKQAKVVFANSGVYITTTGKRHLGAALGDDCFVEEYIPGKVDEWAKQVLNLTLIAKTQPHAAYSAFTHGLIGRWNFLLTVKEISHLLAPLEKVVRQQFIPALTGQTAFSDEMRSLLALPCRLGGLNIIDRTQMADWHYQTSERITAPLAAEIVNQQPSYSVDKKEIQNTRKASMSEKETAHKSTLNKLKSDASLSLRRTIELAGEKEASSLLTVLPIQHHGFHLLKCEFRDAICLRYGLSLKGVSSKCSCGSTFNVDHAMICPKGGFPTIRHNEVRDITADLISEVCSDVAIEPRLNPLSGECLHNRTANRDEEARLDVSARGVWRRGERAFFDIRVFYPNAQSYQEMTLPQIFRNHELEKQRA